MTSGPNPRAKSVSVAEGTRLAMRMSDDEVKDRLSKLGGCEREGDARERQFEVAICVGSVAFSNRIAPGAEEMNRHPDLSISWNKVTVSLATHADGGSTESDFELAAKIDSLA